MLDIEKTIREYIPNVIHMSLATCVNNTPWVCEVHFAYDDELNLYFWSRPSSRHSSELRENSKVAGNIVVQHYAGDKPRGVYFEGKAEELENVDENHPAFLSYSKRIGRDKSMLEETKEENGHRFYKISVENFYVFDARESSPSQKYELPWNGRKS